MGHRKTVRLSFFFFLSFWYPLVLFWGKNRKMKGKKLGEGGEKGFFPSSADILATEIISIPD